MITAGPLLDVRFVKNGHGFRVPLLPTSGALLLLLLGCDGREAPSEVAEEPVTSVKLAEVVRGPLEVHVRAAGILAPSREADLSFKAPGLVTRVLVDAGSRVRKGERLALLDASELDAHHQQARDALAQAERDHARFSQLAAQGTMPRAQLESAQTNVALMRSRATVASLASLHAILVAPQDGTIEHKMIEAGEHVQAGQPVFHLVDREHSPTARVEVSDRDILAIKLGDPATVALDALPELSYAAHVSKVAHSASPENGTFAVELTIEDSVARALPSGMTLKIDFARSEAAATSVPATALVNGRGVDAFVWVINGDRARQIPVRVRALRAGRAVIERGLEGIDRIVDTGAMFLHEGTRIAVVEGRT
jgi:RND family efflux transporter MFP subunit